MRRRATRMDDAFGNALVIKVADFLSKDKVFQQRRTARRSPQRILVVGDSHALIRSQRRTAVAADLVPLSAVTGDNFVRFLGDGRSDIRGLLFAHVFSLMGIALVGYGCGDVRPPFATLEGVRGC